MIKTEEFVNQGGIIGDGTGHTDPNSEDVKETLRMIRERVASYTPEQKLQIKLDGLKAEMSFFVDKNENRRKGKSVPQFLREFLNAINIKNKDFAKYLNLKEPNLSAILNGKRRINIDLAFKLGQLFEMRPELWLQVQSKHEMLQLEEEKKGMGRQYKLEDLLKRA